MPEAHTPQDDGSRANQPVGTNLPTDDRGDGVWQKAQGSAFDADNPYWDFSDGEGAETVDGMGTVEEHRGKTAEAVMPHVGPQAALQNATIGDKGDDVVGPAIWTAPSGTPPPAPPTGTPPPPGGNGGGNGGGDDGDGPEKMSGGRILYSKIDVGVGRFTVLGTIDEDIAFFVSNGRNVMVGEIPANLRGATVNNLEEGTAYLNGIEWQKAQRHEIDEIIEIFNENFETEGYELEVTGINDEDIRVISKKEKKEESPFRAIGAEDVKIDERSTYFLGMLSTGDRFRIDEGRVQIETNIRPDGMRKIRKSWDVPSVPEFNVIVDSVNNYLASIDHNYRLKVTNPGSRQVERVLVKPIDPGYPAATPIAVTPATAADTNADAVRNAATDEEETIDGDLTRPDGTKESGTFRKGVLIKGVRTEVSGQRQEGEFNPDTKTIIRGRVTDPDGYMQEGEFDPKARRIREGKIVDTDGTVTNGVFDLETGELVKGTITTPDGKVKKINRGQRALQKIAKKRANVRVQHELSPNKDGTTSTYEIEINGIMHRIKNGLVLAWNIDTDSYSNKLSSESAYQDVAEALNNGPLKGSSYEAYVSGKPKAGIFKVLVRKQSVAKALLGKVTSPRAIMGGVLKAGEATGGLIERGVKGTLKAGEATGGLIDKGLGAALWAGEKAGTPIEFAVNTARAKRGESLTKDVAVDLATFAANTAGWPFEKGVKLIAGEKNTMHRDIAKLAALILGWTTVKAGFRAGMNLAGGALEGAWGLTKWAAKTAWRIPSIGVSTYRRFNQGKEFANPKTSGWKWYSKWPTRALAITGATAEGLVEGTMRWAIGASAVGEEASWIKEAEGEGGRTSARHGGLAGAALGLREVAMRTKERAQDTFDFGILKGTLKKGEGQGFIRGLLPDFTKFKMEDLSHLNLALKDAGVLETYKKIRKENPKASISSAIIKTAEAVPSSKMPAVALAVKDVLNAEGVVATTVPAYLAYRSWKAGDEEEAGESDYKGDFIKRLNKMDDKQFKAFIASSDIGDMLKEQPLLALGDAEVVALLSGSRAAEAKRLQVAGEIKAMFGFDKDAQPPVSAFAQRVRKVSEKIEDLKRAQAADPKADQKLTTRIDEFETVFGAMEHLLSYEDTFAELVAPPQINRAAA